MAMGTMTMSTTRTNGPAVLDEETEMELAMELLSVQNEEELEYFLGNFLKKVGGGLAKVGKTMLPVLKQVAKVGLPIAAKAAGTFFGGPAGGALGGQLGSMISNAIKEAEADLDEAFAGELEEEEREQFLGDIVGGLIGGEMEAATPAERQVEAAKRFVRVATSAAQKLAAQPSTQNPTAAAISALQSASKKLGLTTKQPGAGFFAGGHPGARNSGRWVRKGNQIVIYGG
jgi:hypothetical protein